jgi:hypothetical protein
MNATTIFMLALSRMNKKPLPLPRELQRAVEDEDFDGPVDTTAFFGHLEREGPNEALSVVFHQRLAGWDYVEAAEWSRGTDRSTRERRLLVYSLLGLSDEQGHFCDDHYPYAPALDAPVNVVNEEARGWKPWYSGERQTSRQFYWNAYFEYLRDIKKWDAKNLAVLQETSRQVIERLQDPESPAPYQSKGLVVGYVQSGKTANFTGVIARAADAGYRLIIVFAGTINILREQTQRRLDKELLGKELCTDEPYERDEDYGDFLSHNGRPSAQGSFDWERLTGSRDDYKLLRRGIAALEFHRHDPTKPFFHPGNLHREKARLLVVKKTPAVLQKLLDDLNKISERVDLSAVPALIVDDESDQASINTLDPKKAAVQQGSAEDRTKTNKAIVKLLKLLPRGQYVGYTATPFANVFINPDDAEDLFPADYILNLPRPEGYMGMAEFYDEKPWQAGDFRSNEQAYVRFVEGSDQAHLPAAIDAYFLSGALKLFREKSSGRTLAYRHHTMLIHNSQSVNAHAAQAREVEDLLERANYAGGGEGILRLKALWEADYRPVTAVRGTDLPQLQNFEELLPFIGECCARLQRGKPVRIINGNNKDDAPNFEKAGVWAILVGGTKLSRGYTVEGLTVSYYRRKAGSADTLMQMGRWFGFRPGYRDLVRLYIGKREPLNRLGTDWINLYEAFRATCQDEEHFRAQLKRYASLEPDERITPKQVPPLVAQHLLPPTSKNKMFNARLDFENLGGEWRESTVAASAVAALKKNSELVNKLLEDAPLFIDKIGFDSPESVRFEAITAVLGPKSVLEFLAAYEWLPQYRNVLATTREFLSGRGDRDPQIDRWLFLYPRMKTRGLQPPWLCRGHEFQVRARARPETGGRFQVYSEPDHRFAAKVFAGVSAGKISDGCSDLRRERQAVFLFYPVRDPQDPPEIPAMGFALLFPNNSIRIPIAYSVRDQSRSEAVVVPK